MIKKLTEQILNWLFPPRCAFCDEIVTAENGVCEKCRKLLPLIRDPYCLKCGKKLRKEEEEYCADCSVNPHRFIAARSALEYNEMVGRSIYRFKYGGRKEYAKAYSRIVYESLSDWIVQIKPDAIVPVPLHKSRLKRRGYNQSALFAKQIGKLCGCMVLEDLAIRVRKTKPQKLMDYAGRQENLKKAFKLRRNDVELNIVLLVDDIYTTGSTLDELAQVFRDAGVGKVYGLTIASGSIKGGAKHGS
ncbi:MAG: ComF family protein [Lachnospiraceae bacterium]|nr:ComF family protein [Lachnospiraceae bacterium]